ncbi:hypothetical protein RJ639_016539 [Escallonia herrerae]|uniref:Protein NBR1 homolog n=1 Tax=Escallonia herrerae TaxID=1293975 RepID=A0AA88VG22_9ASTE|nr:hypothetical protein RJ639_016539 [Escallonia herrerae]
MESTIVVKVKCGETLRRFNARIVDEELELDMDGLREKILGLFKFSPSADLSVTYIDEDGDVVTLADDEDLRDVVRQSLNPLRVTVKLNGEKSGKSYARSSGSSTPMRSPRVQLSLPNLNSSVSEILKSVPEPFREVLSKLSFDLASKANSSAPGLSELVDSLSKVGLTYLNQNSDLQAGAESSTQTDAALGGMGASHPEDQGALKSEMRKSETLPDNEVMPNAGVDHGKVNSDVEGSVMPFPSSLNNNVFESASAKPVPGAFHVAVTDKKEEVKKSSANMTPVATDVPAGDKNEEVEKSVGGALANPLDYLTRCPRGGELKTKSSNSWNYMGSRFVPPPIGECPFTGTSVAIESPVPLPQHAVPFKRSYNHCDGIGSIFHRGVRCDGCGVHPITGPRFKSKVKEDYDLCSICMGEMGNEADYIRMDRPVTYRRTVSYKGLYDPMRHSQVGPPVVPPFFKGGVKACQPKLDSRFIEDVNVVDGTIMAPSTPFTKIWRMRNNGTIVWPKGTQLVWIGGDKLSNTHSVEVQMPADDGLPVERELDIAVDFTAPMSPGRYVSYWRMALPSGQKFGQRVWVLILVDETPKDSWYDNMHGLNLNMPPANVNVDVEAMADAPEPDNLNRAIELVEPIVDGQVNKDQELNFPINDTLLVGRGVSSPVLPEASAAVSYPSIDFSEVAPKVPSLAQSPTTGMPSLAQSPTTGMPSPARPSITVVQASAGVPSPIGSLAKGAQTSAQKASVEQNLLRELEAMGFKQVDLNKEILRRNEYDLGQSVDDLCDVAEWDPILEELKEMGFCDNEVNKRLLKKNNGSIKRVVMDLIAGEQK